MALVTENVIDRWFDPEENSWVYRGFAWLFQNPLWHRDIPSGFSLCPYFWLSLLSWLVFRPFVYLIAIPLISLVKILFYVFGKPVIKLDKFFNEKMFDGNNKKALSLAVVFFFLIIIGLALFFLGKLGLFWWSIPDIYIRVTTAVVALNGLGLFIASVYTQGNKWYKDRCKPIYYMIPIALLSVAVIAFVFPSQLMASLLTSWMVALELSKLLGSLFLYLLGLVPVVFNWIWIGIKFCFGSLLSLLLIPFVGFAIGLWVIILGILSTVFLKVSDKFEQSEIEKKKLDHNVTDMDWKMFLWGQLKKDADYIENIEYKIDYELKSGDRFGKDMLASDRKEFLRRITNKIISNILLESKTKTPSVLSGISRFEFERIIKEYQKTGNSNVYTYIRLLQREIMRYDFRTIVNKTIKKDEEIRRLNEKYAKKKLAQNHRQENCSKYTEATTRILRSIWGFITWPFVKSWFVIKEIGRTFVYMWIVLKDVKKGACPYRRFEKQLKPNPVTKA